MFALELVNRLVFRAFLISVFFLYYEVYFVPGTVHAWILVLGVALITPRAISTHLTTLVRSKTIEFDYLVLLFLLVVFLLGFAVNISGARYANLQSYILMIVTFVYAKESVGEDTLGFLLQLIRAYLIVNSILIFMQILTGDYFISELFRNQGAARAPEIATGVHDGSAQNGMITSFAMSFVFARMLLARFRISLIDWLAFGLGFLSLLFAASRAGLVSFAALSALGVLFVLIKSLRDKAFRPRMFFILGYLGLVFVAVYFIVLNSIVFDLLWELRDQEAGNYGFGVAQYKISTFSDGSTLQRFDIFNTILALFSESPLSFTSVGIGTGSYDSSFGINVHNSWLELLVVSGIYGFLAFTAFLFYLFLKSQSSSRAVEFTPLVFAILSALIFMLAHDVLRGRLVWLALGLLAGLAIGGEQQHIKRYFAKWGNSA